MAQDSVCIQNDHTGQTIYPFTIKHNEYTDHGMTTYKEHILHTKPNTTHKLCTRHTITTTISCKILEIVYAGAISFYHSQLTDTWIY